MVTIEHLEKHKIVGIIRGLTAKQGRLTVEALYQGGVRFIEATMNTIGVTEMIAEWRSKYDGRMIVGAGTVLNAAMAKEAVAAGAQFLVSPNVDEAVIQYARSAGVGVFPGAMTPTEIVRAWEAGATAVKLFPMSTLGIGYFKEIRAPLDAIRLIPTGGIHKGNITEYMEAGAYGLGMGSSLIDKRLIEEGRYDDLTQIASELVTMVEQAVSRE